MIGTDESTGISVAGTTIVIPAYNEEEGVASTLDSVAAVIPQISQPTEIIVVNDGSSDRTREVAEEAGARVISHPKNMGYGRSLKTGVLHAKHELIAILDSDGTYPVEKLPELVSLAGPCHMVIGTRTGKNYMRTMLLSPVRTAFLLLVSFVTGQWIPDPNSGMRVFKRSAVLPLLDRLPNGFSFTTTITLILTLTGSFVVHIPIPYGKRIGRSKVRKVRDALRTGQGLLEIIIYYNPLKIFLVLVPLPLLMGGVAVAFLWGKSNDLVFIGVISIVSSIFIFVFGMLAVAIKGPGYPK